MKHIHSMLIALLLVTTLTTMLACNSDEQRNTSIQSVSVNKKIIISAAGVGPINAAIPFNIHQITLAFDEYSVTEYTKFKRGEETPVIRISENGTPLIIVNPDTKGDNIFSVIINSKKVGNALGHEIGNRYQDIYNYENKEPCMSGTDNELSGKVLCIAPKTENIIYQFSGQWDGPDGEVPPIEILSEWKLESIIWKPQG